MRRCGLPLALPQDFDPDPAERRKRPPLPDHIRTDRWSIPNMLARLRAEGLKARVELAGDPVYERADLAVDVRETGKSRLILRDRMEDGLSTWKLSWGGNTSKPRRRQQRIAMNSDGYRVLDSLVREAGLSLGREFPVRHEEPLRQEDSAPGL